MSSDVTVGEATNEVKSAIMHDNTTASTWTRDGRSVTPAIGGWVVDEDVVERSFVWELAGEGTDDPEFAIDFHGLEVVHFKRRRCAGTPCFGDGIVDGEGAITPSSDEIGEVSDANVVGFVTSLELAVLIIERTPDAEAVYRVVVGH